MLSITYKHILQLPPDKVDFVKIPIPERLAAHIITLTPQQRGNWAEYFYNNSSGNLVEANKPLVEGVSLDGTYLRGPPQLTNYGFITGPVFEVKATSSPRNWAEWSFNPENVKGLRQFDGYMVCAKINYNFIWYSIFKFNDIVPILSPAVRRKRKFDDAFNEASLWL